jgi:protein involved in polysaccharide export with SLBB domain
LKKIDSVYFRYFRYLIFLLFVIGVKNLSGQINENVEEKDTVRLIKETPNGTVIVELNDLEDLSNSRIDSLIRVLDSKTASGSSNIYGHSLFRGKFELVDKAVGKSIVKIPDTYILGFGDEISISIFGTSQFLGKYEIDAKGFIYPEDQPSIYLFGLEMGQAKEVIRKAFSRYYIFRRDQISITLGAPRDILVSIFGEVKKPGSYNISALNTSFQALYNSGGPKKTGSVRNIKVLTDGYESILDVYEMMSNPQSNIDLAISDNSLINVPVAQKIVRIT